jgi:hypothetical protein
MMKTIFPSKKKMQAWIAECGPVAYVATFSEKLYSAGKVIGTRESCSIWATRKEAEQSISVHAQYYGIPAVSLIKVTLKA